jgi:hypothetical protein
MISQLIEWFLVGAHMEKLACPYCEENNKAFMLTNGGKTFFLLPPSFLSNESRVQKEQKGFLC